MAWGDQAIGNYAADKAGRTSRGAYLIEQQQIIMTRPFGVEQFAEASHSGASWSQAASFSVLTPDFLLSGGTIHAQLMVKVAAGSGGQIRLVNQTDSNNGTAATGISSGSYTFSDEISVQVDSVPHTVVTIDVEIQGDGTNLMYVKNTDTDYYYATFWWEYT